MHTQQTPPGVGHPQPQATIAPRPAAVAPLLERPAYGCVWALLMGVAVPLVTGTLDLYLRLNTP